MEGVPVTRPASAAIFSAAARGVGRGDDRPSRPRCSWRPRRPPPPASWSGPDRPCGRRAAPGGSAGRMPGVTSTKPVAPGHAEPPHFLRRGHDAVERRLPGRATPARRPARRPCARRQSSPASSWSKLVSTVMAMTSGGGTPALAALAWAASRAAFIMATPPLAWTSNIQAPSLAASAAAPATVFGMSWYFRSRNTRWPRLGEPPDDVGPGRGEQLAADLDGAHRAAQLVGERERLRRAVDVQRDDDGIAGGHRSTLCSGRARQRPNSSVPTRSADARDPVARHVVVDPRLQLRPDERDRRSWPCPPARPSRRRS